MIKKTKKTELAKTEPIIEPTEPEVETVPVSKTRLEELQDLYAVLQKEKITSISKLEAIISQLKNN